MPPAMVIGLCLGPFNIWCWHQNPRSERWGGEIKARISFASFSVGGLPGSRPALEGVGRGEKTGAIDTGSFTSGSGQGAYVSPLQLPVFPPRQACMFIWEAWPLDLGLTCMPSLL